MAAVEHRSPAREPASPIPMKWVPNPAFGSGRGDRDG